jgi:two-component system chemotaxis sensor kinase CheA
MDAALQTFFDESHELLTEMEAGLLQCERNASSAETINSIFRAAHTIKGSSGLFGLDAIVSFVHVVETALDRVRIGKVAMEPEFAILLLSCKDHIDALVAAAASGESASNAALEGRSAELILLLQARAGSVNQVGSSTPAATVAAAPSPNATSASTVDAKFASTDLWHVSVRFKPDVLRGGMDPLSFIRYLTTFGDIRGILVIGDTIAATDSFDPETCYVGFELSFATEADESRIRSAFEFVADDCVLAVLPPRAPVVDYLNAMPELKTDLERAADILVQCGSLTPAEALRGLGQLSANSQETGMAGPSSVVAEAAASVSRAASPEAASPEIEKRATAAERSVRVDASKLDHLINLVGELITAAAGANLDARRIKNVELQESTSKLAELVESVRDSALQLRMVKIGPTFTRFQRVVNDVSRELGKDITLIVSGEDTELDKTIVEKIADPLTHLVRNAIDHGIESAAVRAAADKPATGTIRLNAFHDSGNIVIEVSDDGGGLKRDRILAKAIERGLVEPGKTLSDSEVFALIFEPGFSTAEKVTNLSGRGVGMDVVKRNITALRGDVEIHSSEGKGTTVSVRLPLTLAIINGFQVGVGESVFVVPLDMVDECIEFSAQQAKETGHDYSNVRGQALPFIRLRDFFGVRIKTSARDSVIRENIVRENIVIVKHGGVRAGLVVDALFGECQTVIKPLAKMFNRVKCVSGSSILGNGEVALILDVAQLMENVLSRQARSA